MTNRIDINDYQATTARMVGFIADSEGGPERGNALLKLDVAVANVYSYLTNAQPGKSSIPRGVCLADASAQADVAIAMLTELLDEMHNVKAAISSEVTR